MRKNSNERTQQHGLADRIPAGTPGAAGFGSKEQPRWLRWYGSERYRRINLLVTVVITFLFLHFYALFKADWTREGRGQAVDVLPADSDQVTRALLLGTTGQFLFLYDHRSRRVTIHPHENVQSITFLAPTDG